MSVKFELYFLVSAFCILHSSFLSAQTPYYYHDRSFKPVEFNIQGTPTADMLLRETEKLTDIVKGEPVKIDTNGTYAIEQQEAISLGYDTPQGAWNAAVNYNGTPSNYPGKIFDNVGWVRGTKSVDGKWGAYLWTLQNRISFRTSETNWWKMTANGVPVAITNVMVGSLGNYGPMSNVVDIGPVIPSNYPGPNQGNVGTYQVDITNVYYQLSIPDIWITPRFAVTCVGGSNVQYTVTGTNIPQGVTWSLIPDLSGLGGAAIQSNGAWQAEVAPGNVVTNYKIRATSKDNTNFYDQVDLAVVRVDIAESNIYICVNNTTALHLTPGSSANVQWEISPTIQTGAFILGSSIGTSIVLNAGSVPTNYMVRAYAVNSTNCYDTCTVTVINVEITNIKFNHDTWSSASDAINIRQNYTNAYDISNGEWIKDVTNIPVCYTMNRAVAIKARFTVKPVSITNAAIWAVSSDSGGSLGDVVKTNVTFSGGVSSPEYVTFQISGTTPNCVKKTTTDVWEWKMENVNGSGSAAWDMNTSGVHTVYTILNEPTTPWDNTAGSQKNAWTKALDFDIESASCNGDSTASNALVHITQYLHTGHGLTYDINGGRPKYNLAGTFDLTGYLEKSSTLYGTSGNVVNCYDQAGGVTTCARLLGVSAEYIFMGATWNNGLAPFGYILATDLVGVGTCNNPFYPLVDNPTNRIPLLGTSGITDLVGTNRSSFGNHAFVRYDGTIFDACAGPHLGNETLVQYATSAIDITSVPERDESPDGSTWGGNTNGAFSTTEVNGSLDPADVIGVK
ncbi:MAG: hypothetical protein KKD33_10400 [Verrucomicrobia bacterium]|nr:hypothetical protein [Verrucomicrobiota bacterium]MBU4365549.1 hypothetical protein [Verrucomicrobiota bacterium]